MREASEAHEIFVAEQFDDAAQQRETASLGMWVFLATEILFFGGMFTGYTAYRYSYPAAFAEASRHLDVVLGTLNTAVLILSSLTMALAVRSAQVGAKKALVALLIATMLIGGVFLAIKFSEYDHKFEEGLVPGPGFHWEGEDRAPAQLFFSFYFIMTGVHALHMIIGIGLVSVITWMSRRGRFSPGYYNPVEITGLYWHFVDLVWIFLFPLLYLVNRHG